jgi:hypothetical protein
MIHRSRLLPSAPLSFLVTTAVVGHFFVPRKKKHEVFHTDPETKTWMIAGEPMAFRINNRNDKVGIKDLEKLFLSMQQVRPCQSTCFLCRIVLAFCALRSGSLNTLTDTASSQDTKILHLSMDGCAIGEEICIHIANVGPSLGVFPLIFTHEFLPASAQDVFAFDKTFSTCALIQAHSPKA